MCFTMDFLWFKVEKCYHSYFIDIIPLCDPVNSVFGYWFEETCKYRQENRLRFSCRQQNDNSKHGCLRFSCISRDHWGFYYNSQLKKIDTCYGNHYLDY